MRSNGAWFCGMILLSLVSIKVLWAYQVPSNVPTIQVTSRLVFLDVTVLDKKGRPVVKGLTKMTSPLRIIRSRSGFSHLKRPRPM